MWQGGNTTRAMHGEGVAQQGRCVTKAQAGGDVNEKERSGQQMKEEKKR
jgi:hypothetical protein